MSDVRPSMIEVNVALNGILFGLEKSLAMPSPRKLFKLAVMVGIDNTVVTFWIHVFVSKSKSYEVSKCTCESAQHRKDVTLALFRNCPEMSLRELIPMCFVN